MDFFTSLFNMFAGKVGAPQMNDVNDYQPKPEKDYHERVVGVDDEYYAPPVPEDDDFSTFD